MSACISSLRSEFLNGIMQMLFKNRSAPTRLYRHSLIGFVELYHLIEPSPHIERNASLSALHPPRNAAPATVNIKRYLVLCRVRHYFIHMLLAPRINYDVRKILRYLLPEPQQIIHGLPVRYTQSGVI